MIYATFSIIFQALHTWFVCYLRFCDFFDRNYVSPVKKSDVSRCIVLLLLNVKSRNIAISSLLNISSTSTTVFCGFYVFVYFWQKWCLSCQQKWRFLFSLTFNFEISNWLCWIFLAPRHIFSLVFIFLCVFDRNDISRCIIDIWCLILNATKAANSLS